MDTNSCGSVMNWRLVRGVILPTEEASADPRDLEIFLQSHDPIGIDFFFEQNTGSSGKYVLHGPQEGHNQLDFTNRVKQHIFGK